MRRRQLWRTPIPWLGALLMLYLLSPIAAFVGRLASTKSGAASPGTVSALVVSAETATIATAVILLAGVPLAYVLARGRSRTSTVVGIAVQLPIALPPLISGILLLYLVGPNSALGRLAGGRLTDDRLGIVLAQVFVAAPFLIIAARAAFATIDPALEEVAATLGHRRWARFLRVAVPAAMPGIVAGLLLAWLRAFGEFGATVILAYHPYSLPVFTFLQFGSTGLDATLLPTAASLGAAIAVLLVASAVAGRRRCSRASVPPITAETNATMVPRLFWSRAEPLGFDLRGHAGAFTVAVAGQTEGRLAIVGRTGAGKSLAMRILAGLHDAERADVRLGDTDLAGTAVEGRRIGYVPQSAALLPHLPVHRQVAWGVHSDPQAVAYWLGQLDADSLANRYPDELSGGQRQRVAIARALASGPRLLLLDEPFAGLDTPTRVELRRDVRRLQSEARITTVLVTHDPDDVAMLADDVIVLSQGRVLQRGPVNEVCRRPGSVEVAKLLGMENALDVTVASPGTLATADGVTLLAPGTDLPPGTRAVVTIDPAGAMLGVGTLRGIVLDVVGYPAQQRVEVGLGPRTTVTVVAPDRDGPPRLGMPINVAIPSDAIRVSVLSS